MNREDIRDLTKNHVINECNKIIENYMKVYDEYYSDNQTRESAFLKDLVDSLQGISAVLEVYTRDKKIHPSYAIDELNYSKSIIEDNISFFKLRLEILKKKEEEEK